MVYSWTITLSILLGWKPLVCPKKDKHYHTLEPCVYNPPWGLGRALKFINVLQNIVRYPADQKAFRQSITLIIHENDVLRAIAERKCEWRSIFQTVKHDPEVEDEPVIRPYDENTPIECHFNELALVTNREAMIFDDPVVFNYMDKLREYSALKNSARICVHGSDHNFHFTQNAYHADNVLFSGEERLSYSGIYMTLLLNGYIIPAKELLEMGRDEKLYKLHISLSDTRAALVRALSLSRESITYRMWIRNKTFV